MNFEYTDEDKEFMQSFRNFCKKEIEPVADEIEEAGRVPAEIFKKLADLGYSGLLIPAEYGGLDLGYLRATLAQEILSEFCGSTFFSVGASFGLFALPVAEFGTEAQKRKYLPPVLSGEKVGCLGVTEPGAGSDVAGITSTARFVEGKYILSGQKTYITNAPIADFMIVLCKTISEEGKATGQTSFLLETDRKGVSLGKPMKKMGLRGSPTGEIFLENVEANEEDILGRKGRGFLITMEAFNRERLALGAYSLGVMNACIRESKKFAGTRKAFGKLISKHQAVAHMISDMIIKTEAVRLLLYETAWMMDHYKDKQKKGMVLHNDLEVDMGARVAEVKLMASTYAREVCNLAVQIHGGAGYMDEYKVSRYYRDIKLAEIGGGTSEIQKQIISHSESRRL
ncbi:MAG: acyl-CoA/acyl-ACP dehydrogenase [Leptospiraceae bacterium]|nr:acyl-CoA/acyl-ACP dehydrogenase [Leptospiraceae bacterium]MCP5511473.1 acyl-CoA/acyl-ACP dehydrogenase [Leptospiraceae bacterium]